MTPGLEFRRVRSTLKERRLLFRTAAGNRAQMTPGFPKRLETSLVLGRPSNPKEHFRNPPSRCQSLGNHNKRTLPYSFKINVRFSYSLSGTYHFLRRVNTKSIITSNVFFFFLSMPLYMIYTMAD